MSRRESKDPLPALSSSWPPTPGEGRFTVNLSNERLSPLLIRSTISSRYLSEANSMVYFELPGSA